MKKDQCYYIKTLISFTFCFIMLWQSTALAQTPDNAEIKGVLPIQMYNARTLSMANTTIADLYGGPDIGLNAALSGLLNNQLFVQLNTYHNWKNNLMQYHLTLPAFSYGPHHVTGRFGYVRQGFDFLPFTVSTSIPEPDYSLYRSEIAYAYTLSNNLSIGTLQSVSYTTNKEAEFWTYFADVGLVYAPDGTVSYGMVFRGMGRETNYEIIENGQTILGSQVARQILEIAATFRYPIEERTYLSISFANEKRFGEDGLWYKGGFEVIPISYVNLRAGAMVNFDQSLFVPRFGLGINTGFFQFDYTMAPDYLIGEEFHQISLTIQF